MATEILMPRLEVLRLLGKNVSFETTVRRFAVFTRASEMVIIHRFQGLRRTRPSLMTLQGPSEMQEFVREESRNGWPDLRLARGLKMKDLSPVELQAIMETWMDAKRRYEGSSGRANSP
jgi:hypothetical protein